MTTTDITTAARRIVRDINGTTAKQRVHYRPDGQRVDSLPVGAFHRDGQYAPDGILWLQGAQGSNVGRQGRPYTQREVQDMLDAAAAHPGDADAQGYYLQSLAEDREASRAR